MAPRKDDRKPKEVALKMPPLGDGELSVSVLCSHNPVCKTSDACIRRTMEYAMGKRATP